MKIAYVADFEAGGTCDEEAIQHAFRELGHMVLPCRESIGHRAVGLLPEKPDLLLFHKFLNVGTLQAFEGVCPRAFWYFDLVDFPGDPTLERRCAQRRLWMEQVTPHVEFGFMSDGDCAATNPKYRVLYQGADERIVGRGRPVCPTCSRDGWWFDLLLTGIDRGGGVGRESFVSDMRDHYGHRFYHVTKGVYREQLRDLIASASIVVCPDSPVTPRYWSNRIWNACGFGGFVLHPKCARLTEMYVPGREVLFYADRAELHDLIRHWTDDARAAERRAIGDAALERTRRQHLYRHRVEELIRVVEGTAPAAPNPEST